MKDLTTRAAEIHAELVRSDYAIQVRCYRGRILTYRYPAPRGYGIRGELIAIYDSSAELEWIEADLIAFVSDTCEPELACTA